MKIYRVYDDEFKVYGRVINDDFSDLTQELKLKECPENVIYVPSDKTLEKTASFNVFKHDYYGQMPIQIGYCNGHNKKLNCLEYHKDSEINVSNDEFILLLGLVFEMENDTFDTNLIKAFLVPSNVAVEIYATTLHYAPCGVGDKGFRVAVVLPKGTNVSNVRSMKEKALFMNNKWLLSHKDSPEAQNGAYIGLKGENIHL